MDDGTAKLGCPRTFSSLRAGTAQGVAALAGIAAVIAIAVLAPSAHASDLACKSPDCAPRPVRLPAAAIQQAQVTISSDQVLPYSEHCLGSDALQAAKALYLHDYDFAATDPVKSTGLLDPRLSNWLAKNWACEKDGVCALETDSWTGAQDGAVAEPIKISLVKDATTPITEAKVRFAFMFDLGAGEKRTPESAVLEFARDGEGQCWKLLDMTSATGELLLDQLSHYQYYP